MSINGTNENLLTDEELETLKNLYEVKKNILSYLDMEEFINKVIKLIEECKMFDFRSVTSKLTINKVKPIFVLKVTDNKLLKRLSEIEKTDETGMKTLDELTKYLNDNIIKEISKILTENIDTRENSVFIGIPDSIKKFIISSIFSIRFSLKDNNIQLLCFF